MSSKAFQQSTRDEMRGLANFLGLDQESESAVNEEVLESRHRTKKVARRDAGSRLSPDLAAQLAAFFAPFNEELWGLIGRILDW